MTGTCTSRGIRRRGGLCRKHAARASVHRYYDSATGQFLSVDPIVSVTGAPYAYAGDSPVNATDPAGLCSDPLGNHLYDGACSAKDRQAIIAAAAQARATQVQTCSNVLSCIWSDPGSIVASFNANRGNIEHAEEGVIGTSAAIAGAVGTAGLGDLLLAAGEAAAQEGGMLGALDTIDLLVHAPFILGPSLTATGFAGALGVLGWYELLNQPERTGRTQCP